MSWYLGLSTLCTVCIDSKVKYYTDKGREQQRPPGVRGLSNPKCVVCDYCERWERKQGG
jgi:hypothetical protein